MTNLEVSMANVATAKRLETRQSDAQTVIQVVMKSLSVCRNRTSMLHRAAQTTCELFRLVVATNLSAHGSPRRTTVGGDVDLRTEPASA